MMRVFCTSNEPYVMMADNNEPYETSTIDFDLDSILKDIMEK